MVREMDFNKNFSNAFLEYHNFVNIQTTRKNKVEAAKPGHFAWRNKPSFMIRCATSASKRGVSKENALVKLAENIKSFRLSMTEKSIALCYNSKHFVVSPNYVLYGNKGISNYENSGC